MSEMIAADQLHLSNGSANNAKVIIGIDDGNDNLLLLKQLTQASGYTFFGARSGQEGIALLARVQPRLILLDIEMPEMDGFETCRRIRLIEDQARTPIVFLTARSSHADVKDCVKAGGNDYVVKPFDPVKLLERVRHWSNRRL